MKRADKPLLTSLEHSKPSGTLTIRQQQGA